MFANKTMYEDVVYLSPSSLSSSYWDDGGSVIGECGLQFNEFELGFPGPVNLHSCESRSSGNNGVVYIYILYRYAELNICRFVTVLRWFDKNTYREKFPRRINR